MISIEQLRARNQAAHILVTEHARQRLAERGIMIQDVMQCIETGEIIRQYEDDKPFPSCLILGAAVNGKYLHAVLSLDEDFLHLITAYYPDSTLWEADFKTRKERQP